MMEYNGIELKPIEKIQAFEHTRELLTWDKESEKPILRLITAFVNIFDDIENDTVVMPMDIESNLYDYACEIPKPKTKKMNSLEIMEYLWERNKTECIAIKDDNSALWSPLGFYIVSYPKDYTYGVLKNGKVTEFEIPEIEVIE